MTDSPSDPSRRTPFWLWPNLLSLDAPVVALSWMMLFKSAYRVYALPSVVYWLLFAAVWVIYLLDRLFDSSETLSVSGLETRHHFHRRYRGLLWFLVIGLTIWALWTGASTLSATLSLCTVYVGILAALYFVHRVLMPHQVVPILPKELFCGIIFAMGSALAPRVYGGRFDYPFEDAIYKLLVGLNLVNPSPYALNEHANVVLGMIQFIGEALRADVIPVAILFSLNCVAISCWEHREGGKNDPSAFPSAMPEISAWLGRLLLGLAAATGLAALFWGHMDTRPVYLAVVLASLGLWAINHWRHRFSRPALRVLADAALLTPWLVIPFVR